MKRLLTGYAVNFNRRHNRYGHLFQKGAKPNTIGNYLCCPQGGKAIIENHAYELE